MTHTELRERLMGMVDQLHQIDRDIFRLGITDDQMVVMSLDGLLEDNLKDAEQHLENVAEIIVQHGDVR